MTEINDIEKKQEYEIKGWDIFRVVLATLLILISGFILVSIVGVFELSRDGNVPSTEQVNEWAEQGVSGLPTSLKFAALFVQLSLIIPVILFLRSKKLPIKRELRLHMISPKLLGYAFLVGLGLVVMGDELGRLMGLVVPLPEELTEGILRMLRINSFVDLITMGVTVALVAPIIEEMLFRGFFQRFFERRRGVTTGVLTTSAIFAAYHFNVYLLIPILLMATFIGAMAWRTESIYPAIIVHSVNNVVGLIMANLDEETISWYNMGDHVSPFVLIIAIGLMIWALREFFKLAEKKGLGGHGPSGDVGTKINRVI